jgi:hypothetical protein
VLNENITSERAKVVSAVNLPALTLPKFNGDFMQWIPFRDMFTQMVDEQQALSKLQKMCYLVENLSGEAAQLVNRYPKSEASYQQAWDALKIRYDNTRLLVSHSLN